MSIVSYCYNDDNDTFSLTKTIDFKQIELNQCNADQNYEMENYQKIFNGDNRFILKFRNIIFNKYKTALCNVDLLYCKGNKIIIFKYTDGLYYIKYEEELFNSFKCCIKYSIDILERLYSIPHKYLTKFEMTDKNISV